RSERRTRPRSRRSGCSTPRYTAWRNLSTALPQASPMSFLIAPAPRTEVPGKDASALCPGSFAVQSRLAIHDVRHIPPLAQKLHYLLPGARHLRPSRLRFRVLLQTPNFVPFELEVHFPQMPLRSLPHRVAPFPQLDHRGILDHRLPPNT